MARLHGALASVQLRPPRHGREVSLPEDKLGELDRLASALPRRINADPEHVEKGLAQLVLTLVELLRQLMERQALRRMENGTLTDEQLDRLGETFMKLEQRMGELKEHFDLEDGDLNLNLGPLGDLL
ncbi:MAG: gas vesicle protein K [Actinobacteria bacterium]|nr:MAG: gas vesicle protein K [Actinomycetota bacterium]